MTRYSYRPPILCLQVHIDFLMGGQNVSTMNPPKDHVYYSTEGGLQPQFLKIGADGSEGVYSTAEVYKLN